MDERLFAEPRRRGRRRVVLKLGSRLLTGGGPSLAPERVRMYVDAVAAYPEVETVIVSSGAIAAGYRDLGLSAPPKRVPERQAAAAVGQSLLMREYAEHFTRHGKRVAQVLLTNDCLQDRKRFVNAKNAFAVLSAAGIVPIVNENDTVSVEEIMVGDNDNLAAHTAALVEADLLVLLTDVAGVYDRDPSDPEAKLIEYAATADELRPYCFAKKHRESRGGMQTKLEAAEKAARYGIPTIIASGWDADAIHAIYSGRPVGTRIAASPRPLRAHEHWMAVQKRLTGGIVVDAGALAALRRGSSLLPKGVVEVVGRFRAGDLISIFDAAGVEHARGIAQLGDRDVDRVKGRHSSEIEDILGRPAAEEVVHADKLMRMEER